MEGDGSRTGGSTLANREVETGIQSVSHYNRVLFSVFRSDLMSSAYHND